ncbi:unnamed protein product [Rotaria sp. Silwood1]|nr:unnamed protein product [Rotaria sp. Silwood1]
MANTIIVVCTIRSSRRVQPINSGSLRMINRRHDMYLLKHIFLMLSIFAGGWTPIYIIAAINWTGSAIPHTIQRIVTILPILSHIGYMINLFVYNRKLRKYLFSKIRKTRTQ